MNPLQRIRIAHGIARRYFIVNGFDGALTSLGIITGFYFSNYSSIDVVINACLGAAVALGVSGVVSAYSSEVAERKSELHLLEEAMIDDLSQSMHARNIHFISVYVALVNGLSPFLICLLILTPLFMSKQLLAVTIDPLLAALAISLLVLFGLGLLLGTISKTSVIASGTKTLLIALVTAMFIYLLTPVA
jgi:predicted membrane protein (TIGR00267 family)